MENTPLPYPSVLKEILKSGAVDEDKFLETEMGTPQGGIISPSLANIALAGLEK